jgi:hypothetical protein
MVDKTGMESGSQSERATGPTSLRREKPIIEGEIVASDIAKAEPHDAAAAQDHAHEQSPEHLQDIPAAPAEDGTIPEPVAHETIEHETAEHEAVAQDAPGAVETPVENTIAGTSATRESTAVASRRTSLWPIAAAIVIGAGLAVGGALYLHTLDSTPDGLVALSTRESELETRLAARLAALEGKPDTASGLRDILADQEKRIAAAETAARDALASAKSALSAAEANRGTNAISSSQPSAPPPQTADLSPLETRIGDLDRRLADLDQKLAQLAPSVAAKSDLSPLDTHIGDLDRRVGDLDQKLVQLTPPVAAKSDLRVAPEAAVRPEAEAEAVAIIAASLVAKVDSGLPYAPELAALANRGVDKSKFATLEPNAATGVPTARMLATRFAALTDKLLAPDPLQAEGSIFDRMMQNAGRLVKVRKVGDTTGEDLPARVGRINAALQAGAVEEALAQWDELPASAKAKSQDFATLAKSRVDAVAAARAFQSEAITALGKTKS